AHPHPEQGRRAQADNPPIPARARRVSPKEAPPGGGTNADRFFHCQQPGRAMNRRNKAERNKELEDNHRLMRAWKRWHREKLDEALAGPHAVIATQVVEFLKTMTPASANALLQLMRSH